MGASCAMLGGSQVIFDKEDVSLLTAKVILLSGAKKWTMRCCLYVWQSFRTPNSIICIAVVPEDWQRAPQM